MRNSPLKGMLKKDSESPLRIDPRFDATFYDPKTQILLNKKGITVAGTKKKKKEKENKKEK